MKTKDTVEQFLISKEKAEEYIRRLIDKHIREKCPIEDFEIYKNVRNHYHEFSESFHIYLKSLLKSKIITSKDCIEFDIMMGKLYSFIFPLNEEES